MATIRQRGHEYAVTDEWCIGRSCLRLGEHRKVVRTCKGFEQLAHGDRCCITRAKAGCPAVLPEYNLELARGRRRS